MTAEQVRCGHVTWMTNANMAYQGFGLKTRNLPFSRTRKNIVDFSDNLESKTVKFESTE